mmetsp:Transcript_2268/g.5021  ORF Transcript_2268/g.5021 Transcript_2268/m.5021 type:complete len:219 (-) Transcript_2268:1309-1965(-)
MVLTYPVWPSSNSTTPSKKPVLGEWPMATNTASHLRVRFSPVTTSFRTAAETTMSPVAADASSRSSSSLSSSPAPVLASSAFPSIFSKTVFHRISIRGWFLTRSARTLLARKLSRRWIRVTFFEVLARTRASSMAVSPPPTTTTCRPENKKPSQVAHDETPPPRSSNSPGIPSHLLSAPVATMMEWASIKPVELAKTFMGREEASILVTRSSSNTAPN